MARLTPVNACLLAMLVMAGAMPHATATTTLPLAASTDPQDPDAQSTACAKSDDESGWGGTSVTCHYRCARGSLLAIGGEAVDRDAAMYGDTACGGTAAICRTAGSECLGVSEGASEEAQDKAACHGHSDEWFDSPITIACAAHPTDPESIVCGLLSGICEGDGPVLVGELYGLDDLLGRCEEAAGRGADGFLLATFTATGYSAVTYQRDAGCQPIAGPL